MNLGKSATSLSRGHRFCLMEIPNMIQTGSSSIRWTPGYRHGGHNLISLIQTLYIKQCSSGYSNF
ncbi:hypothetical protein HanRHA438_Chr11g0513251 [Helianthus annuus]|uniref:Uncharacterized protein n=1 Tax=Helianthus annuus TaxID=4232 RepID=A0A9K3N189_HELAN|nr:hypothetical protein HanXRQr2_Chr11g0500501 [Helianthus annuus]KAJ0502265.1 hypothetical protein HanHA300_Chr11g0410811 [Helianthus annuus]KAJ0510275.1 hypothetical protein HanIR_Chr11g0538841 [Helianthus annuus]KAJ0518188.1 hypothetical protein HanHA89_Chr11g0434491 [Helianthus annuus]KAJ0686219.1 hypothetical protein HanLR1_Chr11g0412141 [Helianthus annuus]